MRTSSQSDATDSSTLSTSKGRLATKKHFDIVKVPTNGG